MLPTLTEGALEKIMNGDRVKEPVLRILDHKKFSSNYKLLLTDGKSNYFSMLTVELYELIKKNILTVNTIVCIKSYTTINLAKESTHKKRIMFIKRIEVLVPGSEVDRILQIRFKEKLKDNRLLRVSVVDIGKNFINISRNSSKKSKKFIDLKNYVLPALSEGALYRIMDGDLVQEPVVQILDYKKLLLSTNDEMYRLIVSDGTKSNITILLATQLNKLIVSNILTEHTIVCIKRYIMRSSNDSGIEKLLMIILNIEVLVPGTEVGRNLGGVFHSDEIIYFTENVLPTLTEGALNKIIDGYKIEEPILQILGFQKLNSTSNNENFYRLLLFDGNSKYFVMISSELNKMIKNKTIEKYAIICLKKFSSIDYSNNFGSQGRVTVIQNIKVLVPGNEVGRVLKS